MLRAIVQPGSPEFLVACLLVLACGVNLLAYLAFRDDKLRAAADDDWRMPGGLLIVLALSGGTLGAKLGQRTNRIPARSRGFNALVTLILIGQIFAMIVFATPALALVQQYTGIDLWTSAGTAFGDFVDNLVVWGDEKQQSKGPTRFGPTAD